MDSVCMLADASSGFCGSLWCHVSAPASRYLHWHDCQQKISFVLFLPQGLSSISSSELLCCNPFLENWSVDFNLIWKSIWNGDFHSLPARPRMLAEPNVISSKEKEGRYEVLWWSGWGDWETDERGQTDQSGSSVLISLPSTFLLLYWVSSLRCLLRPAGAAVK